MRHKTEGPLNLLNVLFLDERRKEMQTDRTRYRHFVPISDYENLRLIIQALFNSYLSIVH